MQVEVTSAAEALKLLRLGSKQRQRAETGLNYNSSRSHSIFTVRLVPAAWWCNVKQGQAGCCSTAGNWISPA
jgi:hypothetical protein